MFFFSPPYIHSHFIFLFLFFLHLRANVGESCQDNYCIEEAICSKYGGLK